MKSAALFDLDGVIVDTEPSYTEFWEMIGRDYFPEDINFAASLKGQTLTYIFDRCFPGDSERQTEVKKRLDDHQLTMSYPLVVGVMEFIDRLREIGVGIAVVTSSDCAKMENLYKAHPGFKEKFDRIFTAEDALRSKPAPDCYISAANYFGLEAKNCVVFEDSFNGLKAGLSSGAHVVGLTTSNPESEIAEYCDIVVADFSQPEVLLKLFA